MYCTLNIKNKKYIIHQVYTPKQGHSEKREYMELLEDSCNLRPSHISILMGDFNARGRKEREGIESFIGPFGEETRNTEDENLIDICVRNDLKIINDYFTHKEHQFTRYRWNHNRTV